MADHMREEPMMKINWRVRVKNPTFWIGLAGAIGTPILAHMGMTTSDLTTWDSVGGMLVLTVSNPYLFGITVFSVMSFLGTVSDPTTAGIGDSTQALGYDEPRRD